MNKIVEEAKQEGPCKIHKWKTVNGRYSCEVCKYTPSLDN